MIKLLNTDCLGNALTKDKASTYNVKFIKNNCCNFNGTSDYICLCDDATVLLGADKIAICFETTTVSYSTIAINLFLDDLNGNGDKIELRNSTTIRWYSNNSSTDYAVPAYNDSKPHELILSKDKTLSLDGINYTGVEKTEGYIFCRSGISLGAIHHSNNKYYFKGKLWNLRIYKNNVLTYHFPMAEGAGLNVYDAKGNYINLNQTHNIITASESDFWSKTQDEYAYNTLNGFKLLSNSSRIPIDANTSEEGTIYQPIPNGKNYSEASLDFSDLPAVYSTSLSSVRYMEPYVNPDPSMGANTDGGWNITSKQTTIVSKNSWFANTRVLYLKNTENTLPNGVTVGLDIKTNGFLTSAPGNQFFYHNASDNPYTHNGNTLPAFFKLKFSFWYKKNEGAITEGALVVGSQYLSWLILPNVNLDNEWHFIEKEVFVDLTKSMAYRAYYTDAQKSIAIGWNTATSDTVAYAGTIADFKYTMSQTYQTLSPVYCKIDEETKSISNILVYDKYQEGLDLTRIKNHLKQF